MKFKLDENLGEWAKGPLQFGGHDVSTVHEQGLCGTEDNDLIAKCCVEGRCMVTLDVEFGNPLMFDPSESRGIVLVRTSSATRREWAD